MLADGRDQALLVCREKRAGAELLGRALLAATLLERPLRLLLQLLLRLVGTLTHDDLRGRRALSTPHAHSTLRKTVSQAVAQEATVLFPGPRGGPLALSPWRHREWNPALRAAGLEHRTVYALRHTYASLSIAAGVALFEFSQLMGTSPAMLDKTYGHMLPDALDRARTALDAFVRNAADAVSAPSPRAR